MSRDDAQDAYNDYAQERASEAECEHDDLPLTGNDGTFGCRICGANVAVAYTTEF